LIFATLKLRFRVVPEAAAEKLKGVRDDDVLEAIQMKAVAAESLDEFERYISSL
jgi:hypothetical protein